MVITQKRGKYRFRDNSGKLFKFATLEEAQAAGGKLPEEEVQVSGVPYKVPAKDVVKPSAVEDAADVMSGYENGED